MQALLTAIAANAPAGSQVILAHEEDAQDVFKPDLIYAMSDNTRLLTAKSFQELAPRMLFYVEESLAALAKIRDEAAGSNEIAEAEED